jgi:surface antigen
MLFSRFDVVWLAKRVGLLYLVALVAVYLLFVSVIGAKAVSLDPAYEAGTSYEYGVSWCGGGPGDYRSYCRRNCTSYVAYMLAAIGVSEVHYRNNGNGKDWVYRAQAKGIPTGTIPKVGAVAYTTTGGSGFGHVAWVDSVNTDGSVNTSNYRGDTESFYTQSSARPEGYIYFSNVGQVGGNGTNDLFAINRKDGGSGKTSFHVINGANPSQFLKHSATALHQTDANWDFDFEDYNKDGMPDLFAINRRDAGSGKTALHVINGANPSQFLYQGATALQQTDANWDFDIEDFNKDGKLDIIAINRKDGGSGKTSFHVINGANPSQFLFHGATALQQTDANWSFDIEDF